MKIKTISAIILSALSLNCFAFQGEGFKIISEKVTQSPGFNGGIISKSVVPKSDTLLVAQAMNSIGKPNEYVKINSGHVVNMRNDTGKVSRYTYTYLLSCEEAYQIFERTIELEKDGSFLDVSQSYGTVQKNKEGKFPILAQTKISGGDTQSCEHTADLTIRK